MLKFDIETSSSAVIITKPINQPVRSFKISPVSWFGTKRFYTEVGADVAFTIGWVTRLKSWFWASSSIEVKGNVPPVTLRAEHLLFKVALRDLARSTEIVWHSQNQYVIRDADHEIARIYIYKATLGFSNYDDYVITVLDESFDLTLLFLYVFCFKFAMAGDGDSA